MINYFLKEKDGAGRLKDDWIKVTRDEYVAAEQRYGVVGEGQRTIDGEPLTKGFYCSGGEQGPGEGKVEYDYEPSLVEV